MGARFIMNFQSYRISLSALAAAVCVSSVGCAIPSGISDALPGSLAGMSQTDVGDVNFSIAHALESEGQLKKAAALYEQILKTDVGRPEALHRLAITQDKLGNRERSQELFRQALEESPEDADLLADYGYSLYLAEEFEESEAVLRRALEAAPEHSRARVNLGLVLARGGRLEEAERAFARAGLGKEEARMNIAFARALDGRLVEARGIYAGLQLKHPADEDLAERIAQIDHLLAMTGEEHDRTNLSAAGGNGDGTIIRASHSGE